jgi:hypothetical protein
MAVVIKVLANGTGSQSGTGPVSGKSWLIKNIIVANTGSAAAPVNVKAAARQIAPKDMSVAAGLAIVLDNEITLDYPNTVAITWSSGTFDYIVNGVERDVS